MEYSERSIICFDSNVCIYLVEGKLKRISKETITLIENVKSPIVPSTVLLELTYLYERKKLIVKPQEFLKVLMANFNVNFTDLSIFDVMYIAQQKSFTRDPFDRLIVAEAEKLGAYLVTTDRLLLQNYDKAIN